MGTTLNMPNVQLGEKFPWTKVCLDNCHSNNMFLGQSPLALLLQHQKYSLRRCNKIMYGNLQHIA